MSWVAYGCNDRVDVFIAAQPVLQWPPYSVLEFLRVPTKVRDESGAGCAQRLQRTDVNVHDVALRGAEAGILKATIRVGVLDEMQAS
jgi:hypothetical protein